MFDMQNRRIEQLANETVNQPSAIKIALEVAYKMHLAPEGESYNELRRQLAIAYAQGYIRGLDIGRARIVRLPPPPTPLGRS